MGDVYCYGLVELSNIFKLEGDFPKADAYKEVETLVQLPGGEAANAAVVLSRLGLKTRIAGTWLGGDVYKQVRDSFIKDKVDVRSLECKINYSGPRDLVFVSRDGRTIFGWFGKLWFNGRKWSLPKESDIKTCRVAAIDPFLGGESEKAARLCVKHNKKYVTIDFAPDSYICINASAVVISREFIDREYPGKDIHELYREYITKCSGLVVFTSGGAGIIYGRKGESQKNFTPFKVKAVDTLGAGDTFRAGVTFGMLKGWDDDKIIAFSSALAAMVCMNFPSVFKSPNLAQVKKFIADHSK